MNRIEKPILVDDRVAIDALSANKRLKCYPHLGTYAKLIKGAYQQYISSNGNSRNINNVSLPQNIEEFLRDLYASPPSDISFITRIRDESDVNCCPMCGSFHSGTLDHLLPKSVFPVFSIFSANLVPACKCNSKRSVEINGAGGDERILHPYFDDILRNRLFVSCFDDLVRVPRVSLRLCIPSTDPFAPAVRFHLTHVVERTSVLRYMRKSWADLLRRPSLVAAELRMAPASRAALVDILSLELDRQDDTHGSKNNWRSVFIAGLLDDHVIDWLMRAFHRPGWVADGPLVDGAV